MIEIKHDKNIEDEPMDTSEARVGEEPGSEVPAAQSSGQRPTTAAGSDESPADEGEFFPVDPFLTKRSFLRKASRTSHRSVKRWKKELLGGGYPPQQGGLAALQTLR
uniref:Uncharacterized protein n=1 Tax=Caenorhabditis japonica TaxID=281687 RepID=A0A8R1IG90_CAEJA